jgi:tRNA modification GTPase
MQGVRLTKSLVEQSNMVLIVNDASLGHGHSEALASDLASVTGSRPMLTVQNKIDLVADDNKTTAEGDICVSAVRGTGLSALRDALSEVARKNGDVIADVLVNARQASLLRSLASSLQQASAGIQEGRSMDFVAVDVRTAIRHLGDIAGVTWSPDILETIFSRFCIGK